MGLFSFLGGLLGAGSAKKGSRKAEAAQLEFLNRALGLQEQQHTQDRADFAPFREAGVDATGRISDFLGLHGAPEQQTAIDELIASPWYQTLLRNGEEAVVQNASATGGLRGGNTQRSLADFRADTLATSIDRMLQQLFGVSGQGVGATTAGSAAGRDTTNAQSAILGQQGQVRAGGLLTRAGINSQMWNNAGSFLDQANPLSFLKVLGLGF